MISLNSEVLAAHVPPKSVVVVVLGEGWSGELCENYLRQLSRETKPMDCSAVLVYRFRSLYHSMIVSAAGQLLHRLSQWFCRECFFQQSVFFSAAEDWLMLSFPSLTLR